MLQNFLEGEQLLVRGDRKSAAAALRRAIEDDPKMALAYYLLAVATALHEPGAAADALEKAQRYAGAQLDAHDQKLVAAWGLVLAGRAPEAEASYRALVAEQPDDSEAWFQLGEVLFHWNPLRGRSAQEAADPFGRAVLLVPAHGAALEHLIGLAMIEAQRPLALALTNRFLEIEGNQTRLSMHWLHAWAAGDQVERAAVLAEFEKDPTLAAEATMFSAWERDNYADASEMARLMIRAGTHWQRDLGNFFLGIYEFGRGRPQASRASLGPLSATVSDDLIPLYFRWLDTIEELPLPPDALAASREAVSHMELPASPTAQFNQRYLRGLLAIRAGDSADLELQIAALQKIVLPDGGSTLSDLVLLLRARAAETAGKDDEALALLDKLELRIPYRFTAGVTYLAPAALRARILARQGKREEALRLQGLFNFYELTDPVLLPIRTLERARLLDGLGRGAQAAEAYALFASFYRDCEPAERPMADEALTRWRALQPKP